MPPTLTQLQKKASALIFLGLLLCGAGCVKTEKTNTQKEYTMSKGWQTVDVGVERMEQQISASTTGRLIFYRFSPTSTYDWHWEHTTSAQSIADWMESRPQATLIANGVYFNEDYSPTGLLIIDRERVGKRRFDDDKSGMIDLEPPVRIINTKREPIDPKLMNQVAQSYPFLISDGQGAISKDSGLTARRTIIGKDAMGNTYLGILTEPLSLYHFMRLLQVQNIAWQEVMNLDGGPSSGIATRFTNDQTTMNSYTAVPNVIIVERK